MLWLAGANARWLAISALFRRLILLLGLVGVGWRLCGVEPPAALDGMFTPPAEFAAELGSYRPPLLEESGTRVRDARAWPRRREEIRRSWTQLMSEWPALLDSPRLQTLSESQREGILWRRVRVPMASEVSGEGWLLLPTQPGPKPGALVVYYEPET
ncbi:MAG: hypothetical protein IT580_09700, partial [Verrucomicrobiales bacterium]|nr:hypothetical protein [Verrucomicrobiales bacterium]